MSTKIPSKYLYYKVVLVIKLISLEITLFLSIRHAKIHAPTIIITATIFCKVD